MQGLKIVRIYKFRKKFLQNTFVITLCAEGLDQFSSYLPSLTLTTLTKIRIPVFLIMQIMLRNCGDSLSNEFEKHQDIFVISYFKNIVWFLILCFLTWVNWIRKHTWRWMRVWKNGDVFPYMLTKTISGRSRNKIYHTNVMWKITEKLENINFHRFSPSYMKKKHQIWTNKHDIWKQIIMWFFDSNFSQNGLMFLFEISKTK